MLKNHCKIYVPFLCAALFALNPLGLSAGVYSSLEFGDSRDTVTRKLQSSNLVEQTVGSTFLGRTGLNGVFKCKAKLAGLTYHLYFGWSDSGGLSEITLRSQKVHHNEFSTTIKSAWAEANKLFSQVYKQPVQSAHYPDKSKFKDHPILITHMWHKGARQTIMIGPGLEKQKSFLAIRFVNQKIKPVRTP